MARSIWKSRGAYLIGVLLCCMSCENKETLIKSAIRLEESGNCEAALMNINKAMAQTAIFDGPLFLLRGKIYLCLGNSDKALQEFTSALHIRDEYIPALYHKALAFRNLEKHDSALFYLNLAIKTKTRDDFVLEVSPNEFVDYGVENDINLHILRLDRGITYYDLQLDSLALVDFNLTKNVKNLEGESMIFIGAIFIENGETTKGCDYLKRADNLGVERAREYLTRYCN